MRSTTFHSFLGAGRAVTGGGVAGRPGEGMVIAAEPPGTVPAARRLPGRVITGRTGRGHPRRTRGAVAARDRAAVRRAEDPVADRVEAGVAGAAAGDGAGVAVSAVAGDAGPACVAVPVVADAAPAAGGGNARTVFPAEEAAVGREPGAGTRWPGHKSRAEGTRRTRIQAAAIL